jgi:hypothetical protein
LIERALSENDNQEALGIEARKNENKKPSTGKKGKKKDQVLGSFRNLGRGKNSPPQMTCFVASRELYTSVDLMLGMYAFLRDLPATNVGVFWEDAYPV